MVTHSDTVSAVHGELSVFESDPQQSNATFTHSGAVSAVVGEPSVFESDPQQSKAMVTHSDAASTTAEGQSSFESIPQKSNAMVTHSDSSKGADAAAPAVFESHPAQSKANYQAGVDAQDDESEYETDE